MFDAQKLLAAFELPTFIDKDGKRTIGTPLSHPQYEKFVADMRAAGQDNGKAEALLKQALLDMGLPADEIIALPDPLYWKAIEDFFRCCRGDKSPAPEPTPTP